ncbi:class I SAM-dependent methyltransferase [Micrococcus sp.]|uniref:class I SAM-dependent methyltransferase n=1 Tax=Micrococcus sp. TaxID=1271 RepID=UPI002A916996|nr:class I SAM-dependent methyltransferase [Micrococcus sp.]MDY6055186.1 class I SAM-dependent methyltransferase [Micrococcus sp.]
MVQKARRLLLGGRPARTGARGARPQGHITRGTTAAQRMRRVDRWLTDVHAARLRAEPTPLAVDLGFGAEPVTAVEMHTRLRAVAPGLQLVGMEIDPERVAHARAVAPPAPGLDWALGGFELATDRPPTVVRAFNVLRQYREEDVPEIWALLRSRLAPHGVLVEGTCSEDGRRAAWVDLRPDGPASLTLAMRLGAFERPSDVAERLPKALIHRHVPGEPVHRLLADADAAWTHHAPLAVHGARQRWLATVRALRAAGWPVLGRERQWRRGEVSVRWEAVAPSS